MSFKKCVVFGNSLLLFDLSGTHISPLLYASSIFKVKS